MPGSHGVHDIRVTQKIKCKHHVRCLGSNTEKARPWFPLWGSGEKRSSAPCIILVAFIHDRFSTLHVYQGRNLSFFLYLKGPQVATGRYLGIWQGRGQVVV